MLGAATVINPIIKIVTTVAILAAAYFFILKPVLDTTEDTIGRGFDAFDQSFDGFDQLPNQIQDQVNRAVEQSGGSERLQRCIERALDGAGAPDTGRVDRCVDRFGP